MDCQEIREQFTELSLRSPGDSIEPGILEHLRDCEACQCELLEYQDAWLLLSAALPKPPVSDELEARVMDRIANGEPTKRTYSQRAVTLKYALAAGLIFLLVGLTFQRLGQGEADHPHVTDVELDQIRSIASQVEKLDELESAFASPELRYVSLTSKEARKPSGFLLHDPMSRAIHFYGTNLNGLDHPNQTLRVWLLNSGGDVVISSSIELSQDRAVGSALLEVAQPDEVKSVIITAESDVEQPARPSEIVILQSEAIDL